jgi:hypothetical protein
MSELPGPGNYNNDDINTFGKNAVKVTIKGKVKENFDNGRPGPGQYENNFTFTKDRT